jgi:hypothetical protein
VYGISGDLNLLQRLQHGPQHGEVPFSFAGFAYGAAHWV